MWRQYQPQVLGIRRKRDRRDQLAVAEMETGKNVLTSLLLSSWPLNRGCSRPACNHGCKNLHFLMKYKVYRYCNKSRSGKIRSEALLVELEKLQNSNLAPSK